jgi:hypothetical protein
MAVSDASFYAYAMITMLIPAILGCASTYGFVRSIRREAGARATVMEWFLSAEVGFLVGAGAFALMR